LTGLRAFLRRHRRIALDTSIFIYHLEANPRYAGLTDPIFAWIATQAHSAVTSTITMTELLVQPYRDSREDKIDAFYAQLSTFPNLDWIDADLEIADLAARFRAQHHLKTPDALQAATAAHSNATGFVTNDSIFRRISAFETLLLDELL